MSVLESVIGWLAPPQCIGCGAEAITLCDGCATSEIIPYGIRCWRCGAVSPQSRTCERCRRTAIPRFVWITTYYEDLAKALVQKYKFDHQRAAAIPLAKLMAETFQAFNSDSDIQKTQYLVVPVPTATSRVRQRSFDQTTLLARTISRELSLQSCQALGRHGQSRQLGAPRSIRLSQPEGKYYVRLPSRIAGRNILLIDDVITTGATLQAATRVLRAAGARHVDALVFAKRL